MRKRNRNHVRRLLALLGVAAALLGAATTARAQGSICGCEGLPSLGAFDSRDPETWVAAGVTSANSQTLRFPLPADGVLVFDSVRIDQFANGGIAYYVEFVAPPDRPVPPVTFLVAGDFRIGPNTTLYLQGATGGQGQGTSTAGGTGGTPGPGGFRGGDGAYQLIRPDAARGGAGFGPFGGEPGTATPLATGSDGAFGGSRELLPLIGGSGGGGGASTGTDTSCIGGGGGGGGGAILIAANGTATVEGNIYANGGGGGSRSSATCASSGGNGGGGAVRIVADRVEGSARIYVYGQSSSSLEGSGRVRIEANEVTIPVSSVIPAGAASFDVAPGPIVNPLQPTVRIATVNGSAPPDPPLGALGRIDLRVETPGPVPIEVATTDVPAGTTVEVTVKPRLGGAPVVSTATLEAAGCDAAGSCEAVLAPDLAAGSYVLEARATFATP
jgi:hypothetical protein